jgi:lipopolysaccharide biosynthesis protein
MERAERPLREPRNVDVVVVIHIYYIYMVDELSAYLNGLKEVCDFDVLVTISAECSEVQLENIVAKLDPFYIECMENRGRDVLPFLNILKYLDGFKYGLKIHTKNNDQDSWTGPSPEWGKAWRDVMWESLMIPDNARTCLNSLGNNNIYAPPNLWIWNWVERSFTSNVDNMNKLGALFNINSDKDSFLAGNMFWFQIDALLWLKDYVNDLDPMFEKEEGADDGKMEHAVERMIHKLANRNYYKLGD